MKKNRKGFLVLITILVMIVLMGGCQKKEAAGPAAAARKLIGLNIGAPYDEFFRMVEAGCKQAFADKGYDVIITYGQFEKITENAATMIAQGIDALVDFGCIQEYGKQAVMMANEIGAPTISIDVYYEGGYFMGANNEQAGEVVGKALVDWVNKNWGGQVDGIFNAYSSATGEVVGRRTNRAVEEVIKAFNLDPRVEFKFDGVTSEAEGSRQALMDYLSAHPEYRHVVCVPLTMAWLPTMYGGVETMNRGQDVAWGTHSEVSWVYEHYNTTPENQDTLVGVAAYFPYKYGEYIANMLETLFKGGDVDTYVLMDHVAITRGNYKKYEAEWNEWKNKLDAK
jgi:ABC-type sugar transport system substrate-binding protein